MPCIWGRHNGSQLILSVVILPTATMSGAAGLPPGAPLQGLVAAVNALVDTGATTTCITEALAKRLNMQPIGKVPLYGVAGIAHHNNYLFNVGFPFAFAQGVAPPAVVAGLPPPAPGEVQGQVF